MKVSVIVPVYKVEEYIERCARSLFEQSLDEMEFIFVDDASPDGSVAVVQRVLEEYPDRKPFVRVIRHERNQGVAAARTSGMKAMRGEYMAHCDADDWVDADMYERMYAAAKAADADIVTCRYIKESSLQKVEGHFFSGSAQEALLLNKFSGYLWNKIIRSSIIKDNRIYPFSGIDYNEDLNVIVRALCYSEKVVCIMDPLYHYRIEREGSICQDYFVNVKSISVKGMKMLDEFLDDFGRLNNRPEISAKLTVPLKFWMKSGFYSPGHYGEWRRLWPECRWHILKVKSMSVKERLLMFLRTFF